MNKLSFFYVLPFVLFVPITHAMEQNLINPTVFTQKGKDCMNRLVNLWVKETEKSGVATGLAAIFKTIQTVGVDNLIIDQEVLNKANIGLDILYDPEWQQAKSVSFNESNLAVFSSLKQIGALIVLEGLYPDFKLPHEGSFLKNIRILELSPKFDEFLKCNENLDAEDISYIGAYILVSGYFTQTEEGH